MNLNFQAAESKLQTTKLLFKEMRIKLDLLLPGQRLPHKVVLSDSLSLRNKLLKEINQLALQNQRIEKETLELQRRKLQGERREASQKECQTTLKAGKAMAGKVKKKLIERSKRPK